MKNEIIAKCCRICLAKAKKLRSLYTPIDEEDEPPNRMLYLVTGIEVEELNEYETLPKSICKNCELSLSMAFQFRENALKTQKIITEHLKQLQENDRNENEKFTNDVKHDETLDLETMDYMNEPEGVAQDLSNEQDKYYLENDEELSEPANGEDESSERSEQDEEELYSQQKESLFANDSKEDESEAENIAERYNAQQQQNEEFERDIVEPDSRISDNKEEDEYTEQEVEIISDEEQPFSFKLISLCKPKSTKTKKKMISKKSTNAEKSKAKLNDITFTENVKIIPRRGRKPSNNSNQHGHICDICGNAFAKRGRMMEHRQRHDKECRFCCEICDQKFFTRELLRKHMFSHSGGKPLKCEYCSRTFYYESVRKAHESVHKGLRPYVCDACGKSFSYAHALKKHKLIHAEIKLYRCEYCNKDFRLQHHMKQHELTKIHQNAVRFAKTNIPTEDCDQMLKSRDALTEDILFIEEIADDQLIESR